LLLALATFRELGAFDLHRALRGLFRVPPLGWRDGEDRPPGHGIVRQALRDSADAPGEILGPRGNRQTHAAHVYESAPGLARGTRVKDAELDEIAHSLGFDSRRPDEVDLLRARLDRASLQGKNRLRLPNRSGPVRRRLDLANAFARGRQTGGGVPGARQIGIGRHALTAFIKLAEIEGGAPVAGSGRPRPLSSADARRRQPFRWSPVLTEGRAGWRRGKRGRGCDMVPDHRARPRPFPRRGRRRLHDGRQRDEGAVRRWSGGLTEGALGARCADATSPRSSSRVRSSVTIQISDSARRGGKLDLLGRSPISRQADQIDSADRSPG
jgi:hypothetical protein